MKRKAGVMIGSIALWIIMLSNLVEAPPSPHNIQGVVFNNGSASRAGGIPVSINNTVTGDYVVTRTLSSPPFPPFLGSYSTTINGTDEDAIIVSSWNSTHYGRGNTVLAATTTYMNITLNLTRPSETNVTILLPSNNSVRNTSDGFNVTASIKIIGGQDGANCNATISFSNILVMNISATETFTHPLGNMPLGSLNTTAWNITGVREGSSNVTVIAECSSDAENFDKANIMAVSNITIKDTTAPSITLEFPYNNSWSNLVNLTLRYNASDISGIKNCSLYFDSRLNLTNLSVATGISQNFTIFNPPQGNRTWLVSCYDNSSNYNLKNSSEWIIKIDTTFPAIFLISPENSSTLANNSVIFQYNVTDNLDIFNCSLIINSAIAQTNSTITKNITQNFTRTLAGGIYNWSVRCADYGGNFNDSETRILNVTDPDIAIYSENIFFSSNNPVETENITINATILNIGDENATGVVIQFFESDPNNGLTQIGEDITVDIAKESNITVTAYWTAKIGSYRIVISADPPIAANGSITELNESNNNASKAIVIPAYITYYGYITSDIVLGSPSNLSIFVWFNESNVAGNLFVVDSDSRIEWNSLIALGINLSSQSRMDDFLDADIALNMTFLSDSLNRTFTSNNLPIQSDNFTIYGNNITNVAIVNSTNNTNFITGIMWDYSDPNNGEYNGTQDIIFAAKINTNKEGAYGIYDYELKVPAKLREYVMPNIQNTLTFYIELK